MIDKQLKYDGFLTTRKINDYFNVYFIINLHMGFLKRFQPAFVQKNYHERKLEVQEGPSLNFER